MITDEKVWKPDNLNGAWTLSNRFSDHFCFVSGGTWLRTQWEAGTQKMAPHLISLENVTEINEQISETTIEGNHDIVIGAFTSLAKIIKSPLLNKKAPLLVKACKNIAAPSVRNQGTVGGNILSAVGDAIPALLVMGAKLSWFNGEEIVIEALDEWLKSQRVTKRILISITIPEKGLTSRITRNDFSFYIKIGRRETFIPSLVTVAGKGMYDSKTDSFRVVRLAVGGGSIVPIRLKTTETELQSRSFSKELLQEVYEHVRAEYQANEDVFSSAFYKNKVAANLIVSELYRIGGGDYASE